MALMITAVTMLATVQAMFIRTFMSVLGAPLTNALNNNYGNYMKLCYKNNYAFMAVPEIELKPKHPNSSKKVTFELSGDQLKNNIIRYDTYQNKPKNRSKNTVTFFDNQSKCHDIKLVQVSYQDSLKVNNVFINVTKIKNITPKDAINSKSNKFKVYGSFSNKDDVVFEVLTDVRLSFMGNFTKKKRRNQSYPPTLYDGWFGYNQYTYDSDSDSDSDSDCDSSVSSSSS